MSYKLTYKEDGATRWLHRSSYYDIVCEKNKLLAKGFRDIKLEEVKQYNFHSDATLNDKTKRKIKCVETSELFNSAVEAGKDKGCCPKTIIKVLIKEPHHKTAGGYHWEYVYE